MIKFLSTMCVLHVATSVTVSASIFISDDFDDNSINSALWDIAFTGSGGSVAEQNGRVEFHLGAGASGNKDFGVAYVTQQAFMGDFDLQVSFSLLNWPAENGVRLGMGLTTPGGNVVERLGLSPTDHLTPPGEFYVTHFLDGVRGFIAGDNTGALRLTRVGSIMRGYFGSGGNWITIHEGPGSTASTTLAFGIWSDTQAFSGLPVGAAIDNFSLTAVPVPEPSQSLMACGGACLTFALLRRYKLQRGH